MSACLKSQKKKMSVASIMDAVISKETDGDGKAKAGRSGGMFESVVLALKSLGFKIYSHNRYLEVPPGKLPARYVICRVPYDNLLTKKAREYGMKRKAGKPNTEFVIVANDAKSAPPFDQPGPLTVRVECKWQAVAGTTQYKLFGTVLDLQYCAPERNVILLMEGEGFDPVLKHLIREVAEDGLSWDRAPEATDKLLKVMNLEQFIDWCNEAFGE